MQTNLLKKLSHALELNLDLVKFAKEPKATNYYAKANNDFGMQMV